MLWNQHPRNRGNRFTVELVRVLTVSGGLSERDWRQGSGSRTQRREASGW